MMPEIALHTLEHLPKPIQWRLLKSYDYQEKIDLNGLTVPFKETGRIRSGDIFDVVRRIYKTGKEEKITNLDGVDLFLSLHDGNVSVGKSPTGTETDPALVALALVSPDPQSRLDAFKETTSRFGPTGPYTESWRRILLTRAPTNREISEIFDAIYTSIPFFQQNLQDKIDNLSFTSEDLLPNEASYFLKLCGPFPFNYFVDEYIDNQLPGHHQSLLTNDLFAGLQLCLPGNIRYDILPFRQLESIPVEVIIDFITNMASISDPFSILSLVEIALLHRQNVPELNALTGLLVDKLCSDTLLRHDGVDIYTFFPELVHFCLNRLRLIDGMLNRPAFWHRICAFTHAGILTKILDGFRFDPKDLLSLLGGGQSRIGIITDVLAFRHEPMWSPERLTRDFLQAEICSRLKMLAINEEKRGHQLPHTNLIDDALTRLEKKGVLGILPGPLEAHLRPIRQKPRKDIFYSKKICLQELLNDSEHKFPWNQASYLSQLEPLSSEFRKTIAKKLPGLMLSGIDIHEQVDILTHIASIAVFHEDSVLGSALIEQVFALVEKKVNIQIPFFLILMTSCAVEKENWLTWLTDHLEKLAFKVSNSGQIKELQLFLEALKYNLPFSQWKFSKAEALCGSVVKWGLLANHKNISMFHGNRKTRVFHQLNCKYYNSGHIRAFENRTRAINKGYKPCAKCKP